MRATAKRNGNIRCPLFSLLNKANLTVTPVGVDVIDGIVSGLFKLDAQMVTKLKSVLVT
ncbi:MAG: hypothetical protein WD688_07180 [Candidatus Binatia bacterium]